MGLLKPAASSNVPLKAMQNCEFEILKYIRDVCEEHGLRYYLAYGTLIGAIRHQGFIPWDDDMDVHIPREDYLKLIEIMAENPHPYYRLVSRETSPKFTHILAKMIDTRTTLIQKAHWTERVPLGVYVDIFVLDGAGNTPAEAEAAYYEAFACYFQWEKAATIMFPPDRVRREAFNKWLHHIPAKLLGERYYMDRHTAICMERDYDAGSYVAAMAAATPEPARNVWKKDWFGDGSNVTFNGEHFRAPADPDAVLRPEYGDYMQLPPPEQRASHHRYVLSMPDELLAEFLNQSTNPN